MVSINDEKCLDQRRQKIDVQICDSVHRRQSNMDEDVSIKYIFFFSFDFM